jgi:hypothetical protein
VRHRVVIRIGVQRTPGSHDMLNRRGLDGKLDQVATKNGSVEGLSLHVDTDCVESVTSRRRTTMSSRKAPGGSLLSGRDEE